MKSISIWPDYKIVTLRFVITHLMSSKNVIEKLCSFLLLVEENDFN